MILTSSSLFIADPHLILTNPRLTPRDPHSILTFSSSPFHPHLFLVTDTFYIRAFDKSSDKDLLGRLMMERAKDIAQQRPPISHQHPDRDVRWQTTQALREPATAEAKL